MKIWLTVYWRIGSLRALAAACCLAALTLSQPAAAGPGELPEGWTRFESPDKRFTVNLPAAPVSETANAPSPFGQVKIVMFAVDKHEPAYRVGFVDYRVKPFTKDRAELLLDQATEGLRRNRRVKKVEPRKISLDGHPGREQTITFGQGVVCRQRQYIVGNRSYILTAVRPSARDYSAEIQAFFDSFRLTNPKR